MDLYPDQTICNLKNDHYWWWAVAHLMQELETLVQRQLETGALLSTCGNTWTTLSEGGGTGSGSLVADSSVLIATEGPVAPCPCSHLTSTIMTVAQATDLTWWHMFLGSWQRCICLWLCHLLGETRIPWCHIPYHCGPGPGPYPCS